MIPPGALVMLTPVVVGILFGTRTLAGLLAGALVSGVQMAVSMSNTGGAWDNAKKYVEVRIRGVQGSGQGIAKQTHWCRPQACYADNSVLACMLLKEAIAASWPLHGPCTSCAACSV